MILLSLLSLVGLAIACEDHHLDARDAFAHSHAHVYEKREYPQVQLPPPTRPLVWGDFNVIHTTDTHGWLLGHQHISWPEPNYSGDLGDFASFVGHMKNISIEKKVDLLLVDSGDLHDGTGLSDGYPPGGVDAHESNKFIERLPYDVMTIGNHELLLYANAYDMYTNFVPNANHSYLTSNVNITIFDSDGNKMNVPIGDRYKKFTTRNGRNVTAFGILYDFTRNATNTTVHTVAEMVTEKWFMDAIADEPDVFLLAGHMPVNPSSPQYKWDIVKKAIRDKHPDTPIMIFGGHTHIRDCQQHNDPRSMALQSGRYMETIGWMSANLTAAKGNKDPIAFSRRYLDQNRVTYQFHTGTTNSTFDTLLGQNLTHGLEELAANYSLGYLYGASPQDFTWNRDPYPSKGSLLSLYIAEAAPYALAIDNPRNETPNIIIANAELLRFDVLQGNFTKNDQLSVVPPSETDRWYYIQDVNFSVANQVLPMLNKGSVVSKCTTTGTTGSTLGYVTIDGCGAKNDGDDVNHVQVVCNVPTYVGSNPPNVTGDPPIDLVFLDFIESRVLDALNKLQTAHKYTPSDVANYTSTLTNAVLGLYAKDNWKTN